MKYEIFRELGKEDVVMLERYVYTRVRDLMAILFSMVTLIFHLTA